MKFLLASWLLFTPLLAFEQPSDEPAQQVLDTLTEMWDAIEKGDLERYASRLHPDYSAFGETDTYRADGKDLELRSLASYLARVRGVHTEMHQPKVNIRGDVAWVTYYWTDEGYRRDTAGTRFTSRGKSTRIFVKVDGLWLCIHGHFTSVD